MSAPGKQDAELVSAREFGKTMDQPPGSATLGGKLLASASSLPRAGKQCLVITADFCFVILSTLLALFLRSGQWVWPEGFQLVALAMAVSVALPVFHLFGLYKPIYRSFGCLSPLKLSHYCGSIGRVLNGSEAIFG